MVIISFNIYALNSIYSLPGMFHLVEYILIEKHIFWTNFGEPNIPFHKRYSEFDCHDYKREPRMLK